MPIPTHDLFSFASPSTNHNIPMRENQNLSIREFPEVPGLGYISNFLSPEEEQTIITNLDNAPWSTELERRVQHYGFKYNYRSRRIDESMRVGALPQWMQHFGERLVSLGAFSTLPDQAIVNEYLPGQGIAPHVDCEPCFGENIVSITLCSGCQMDFTQKHSKVKFSVWLAPRSAIVLSGESRYDWLHGISKRKSDIVDEVAVNRARRISLTYRTVINLSSDPEAD